MKRLLFPFTAACLIGCTPSAPQAPKETSDQILASGLQVYTTNCLSCHQVDGSGVPNMQPALAGDPVMNGDPNLLIRVVLKGPAAVLPEDRPTYGNTMPAFHNLTDQQIADVLTYVRHNFGNQSGAIEESQVQTIRSQLGL
jgi:mono/diheme cytochrome c family protein